jgi:hypothetical protein
MRDGSCSLKVLLSLHLYPFPKIYRKCNILEGIKEERGVYAFSLTIKQLLIIGKTYYFIEIAELGVAILLCFEMMVVHSGNCHFEDLNQHT